MQHGAEVFGGLEIPVTAYRRILLLDGQARTVTLTDPEPPAVDPEPQQPPCLKPEALQRSVQTLGFSCRRDHLARPEDGEAAHSVSGAAAYMYVPIYIHRSSYIQTDRQTDRQIDGQTCIHTYIHT